MQFLTFYSEILSALINVKTFAVAGYLVFLCAGSYLGYTFEHSRFETYKAEATTNYTKLLEEKIALDRANVQRVTELEKQRLEETEKLRADYEATIANLRAKYSASGLYKSSSTSYNSTARESRDSSRTICFSEAEFYERVAGTLDIGRQADELAVKYNTLLKICKGE